jgi:hypothetical protein
LRFSYNSFWHHAIQTLFRVINFQDMNISYLVKIQHLFRNIYTLKSNSDYISRNSPIWIFYLILTKHRFTVRYTQNYTQIVSVFKVHCKKGLQFSPSQPGSLIKLSLDGRIANLFYSVCIGTTYAPPPLSACLAEIFFFYKI